VPKVLVSLASLLLLGLAAPAFAADPLLGRAVDGFSLRDVRGETHALADHAEAKLVVLAFLGTDCPLVKLYSPELQRLADEFAERGVVVLGVNANSHDSLSEIAAHAKSHGIDFPVLKDVGNQFADELGAKRTPEIFVLGPAHDGTRRIVYHGRIDDRYGVGWARERAQRHDLRIAIEELLAGKPVTVSSTDPIGCFIGRVHEPRANAPVTYGNQISRLVEQRCVECHRKGEIAPFELTSYEDVAGWAETMLEVVEQNRMPPWHADPAHGTFANDRSLTDDEKELLRQWVRDGAPRGDMQHVAEPRPFVEGWRLPVEPDLVVPMADEPFEVPAEGEVRYQYFKVDPQFTEDKYVRMAEVIPGDRQVVHHVLVLVKPPGGEKLDELSHWVAAYVPGSGFGTYPAGMAKKIPAGSELLFQVHYTPVGTKRTDLCKVGFVFADPAEVTDVVITRAAAQHRLKIPPHAADHQVQAAYPPRGGSPVDVRLLALMPHMHLRGKSFRYEAHLPDGTTTTLLDVPAYDFNWQTRYVLAEPLTLPKGTTIRCVAAFDNSEQNVWNPDPTKEVNWGDQTWEEMMIGYFDVAVPIEQVNGGRPAGGAARAAVRERVVDAVTRRAFDRLDKDGDGRLTKAELQPALRPKFDAFDTNSNGAVTPDEFAAGTAKRD
jgi:peroxiredoxin